MHSQDNCRLNSITFNGSAKRPTTINKAKSSCREKGEESGKRDPQRRRGNANDPAPKAAAHFHTVGAISIITLITILNVL